MSKNGPSNAANNLEVLLGDIPRLECYMLGHGVEEQAIVDYFHRRFYGEEIIQYFASVWGPHICERVRQMDSSEAMADNEAVHYAEAAYNVLCAALYVQAVQLESMPKIDGEPLPEPGFPPKVMPASRFREHLRFDDNRMTLLRRLLSFVPSKASWKSLACQATVADYVDAFFQESRKHMAAKAELGIAGPD